MGWKFWQKDETDTAKVAAPSAPKPSKPRDLPPAVGRTLVVEMKKEPDWVWKLKCVMKPVGTDETVFELRVFDPAQAWNKAIQIKSYGTLDEHPDLILYEGTYRKKQNLFQIMKRAA